MLRKRNNWNFAAVKVHLIPTLLCDGACERSGEIYKSSEEVRDEDSDRLLEPDVLAKPRFHAIKKRVDPLQNRHSMRAYGDGYLSPCSFNAANAVLGATLATRACFSIHHVV